MTKRRPGPGLRAGIKGKRTSRSAGSPNGNEKTDDDEDIGGVEVVEERHEFAPFKCRVKSAECRVEENFLTLFGNYLLKYFLSKAKKVTITLHSAFCTLNLNVFTRKNLI